ncbi:alpha-mannosidase [bacterium]|nr:alpha-mannosidase [bacterium]
MNDRIGRRVFQAAALLGLLMLITASGCRDEAPDRPAPTPEPRVHAFYYPWYGTPELDGSYRHWNHAQLGAVEDRRTYQGGDDIGADFYPSLGCYSSGDPVAVQQHMHWAARAGIGTLCVSWWGVHSFEDRLLPVLLKSADLHGLELSLHLEPFPGRDAATMRGALIHLVGRYGDRDVFYHLPGDDRLVCFVYDSYLTPAAEWAALLRPGGRLSIRGTNLDVVMLGLWVEEDDGPELLAAGFDGFYTYFATDGFTYGSTVANWSALAAFARAHDLIFVPCVGPGYADLRIRPWNIANQREREAGAYYRRMAAAAVATSPDLIGLTSFNEWHEGTQIEPAQPNSLPDFVYRDYLPLEPEAYLDLTAQWVAAYRAALADR